MFFNVLLARDLVWNLPLFIGLSSIAFFYVFLIKRFTNIKVHHKQPFLFFLSLFLFYLITGSPLSTISHLAFSLHMLQMSMFYFVIPPLLLSGVPGRLYRRIREFCALPACINSTRFYLPKIALLMFGALFLFYHLPFVLDLLGQNPLLQNVYSVMLFLLAVLMWLPIVSPDPNERLSQKEMKSYAWLSSVIIMPACAVFIGNALTGGMANPFGGQLTAQLCTPVQSDSAGGLLPYPFHTEYEQAFAGVLMLSMHKASIIISCRLGNKSDKA